MAALASSLIRQKRAVKDDQTNRPVANKRKPCPKSNKSLCQKQILVLISKVRLCGGRKGRNEKRPGESELRLFLIPCLLLWQHLEGLTIKTSVLFGNCVFWFLFVSQLCKRIKKNISLCQGAIFLFGNDFHQDFNCEPIYNPFIENNSPIILHETAH